MLTLPNIRYDPVKSTPVNEQELEVFRLIERDGAVSSTTLANKLEVGATRSYNILKKMVRDGKLLGIKKGRKIEYTLLQG
jgi:Mn-dependent DtxR family transcriptional regulator